MRKLYHLTLGLLLGLGLITVNAQVNLPTLNTTYHQNFNTLASSGTTNDISTLPQGWTFLESGSNGNTTYAAGTGSSNAGNTYSFGLDATDRAFGGLLSGSVTPTMGASFVNNTGSTITSLQITYRGEQWRLGALARGADRLDFQYSVNATTLNSGSWTDVDALDFSSPVVTGSIGAVNGNDPQFSTSIAFTISDLTIANGAVFFIRWQDMNVTGSDDGLAVDDFSITPSSGSTSTPSLTFSPSSLDFGDVMLTSTGTLTYAVKGSNVTSSISLSTSQSVFELSLDGTQFQSSILLPDTGGVVYVRFTPTASGIRYDSVTHSAAGIVALLSMVGNGFNPTDNIISIAEARSKPVGTTVTIAGRITVANELGNPAYVQDATSGIPVFDFALANNVTIGDSVIVTGPMGVFNDQKQISGNGISYSKPDSSKRFITPKLIEISALAANEGLLVTVQNVQLVNKNFVFYPQSTERITAGTLQADLRIDGDTDIPGLTKPQENINITGVVGRFRTNAQLLSRFRQDIPGASEPYAPTDSISKDKTLDVVTYNLEFFGARQEDYSDEYGPEDEALQLENIKKVILANKADVIAVQEVSDEAFFHELVAQLGHYGASCSQRYSYSFTGEDDFPPQKVCFIYDTTTVEVLSLTVLFESLYDQARTTNPSLIPEYPGNNPSSFYSSGRLPYMLTANVTIQGVKEKISFVNLHAKSGATQNDRSRRLYDAKVLKDSLDTHFANEKIIILGDLNDDLDQSIAAGAQTPYAGFVLDTLKYLPVTKALSDIGARSTLSFSDVIDHQIISTELREQYLKGSAQIITPFALISNYATTTTDHLPVLTRYGGFEPTLASFVTNSFTVNEVNATHTINLAFSKPLNEDGSLTIAVQGNATYGSDFVTSPASSVNKITLPLTAGDTLATITLTLKDDLVDELAETIVFTINTSAGGIQPGVPSSITVTINDNDIPTIAFKECFASAEEGSGPYAVKLKLSSATATEQNTTIQLFSPFWTIYGQDFITEPPAVQNKFNLSIPAGSNEAQFTITPLADGKREIPLEFTTFYISETSEGLKPVNPLVSLFYIIDARPRLTFIAYPNPTHGVLKLRCDELEEHEKVSAELRNSDGSKLFCGKGTLKYLSTQLTNKLSCSRKDVYSLTLYYDEEIYSFKIVKN
jgi:hypothetical protein